MTRDELIKMAESIGDGNKCEFKSEIFNHTNWEVGRVDLSIGGCSVRHGGFILGLYTLTDIRPIKKEITWETLKEITWETLTAGDFVVNKEGYKRKILDRGGDFFFPSSIDDFDRVNGIWSKKDFTDNGYTIVQPEPSTETYEPTMSVHSTDEAFVRSFFVGGKEIVRDNQDGTIVYNGKTYKEVV